MLVSCIVQCTVQQMLKCSHYFHASGKKGKDSVFRPGGKWERENTIQSSSRKLECVYVYMFLFFVCLTNPQFSRHESELKGHMSLYVKLPLWYTGRQVQ